MHTCINANVCAYCTYMNTRIHSYHAHVMHAYMHTCTKYNVNTHNTCSIVSLINSPRIFVITTISIMVIINLIVMIVTMMMIMMTMTMTMTMMMMTTTTM